MQLLEESQTPMTDDKDVEKAATDDKELDIEQAKRDLIEEISWADFLSNTKNSLVNRTAKDWLMSFVRVGCLCFFLYFFLFALDLMGVAFKVLGGCTAGDLFSGIDNPIAGLMIGVLATTMIQSSSTSTSIVVSLVGAEAMSVRTAIPVIMGANIGTSVTSTLVAMGQMNDPDIFERAFAGGTVHDMFNILSVAVLLPLELATGYLYSLTDALKPTEVEKGEKWEGPLKKIVSPLVSNLIVVNKDVTKSVSLGETTCDAIYAAKANGTDIKGLIKCSDDYGCPDFYDKNATLSDDTAAAIVCLIISLFVLVVCLYALVKTLLWMLNGVQDKMLRRATTYHPIISMLVGTAVTILVQSSSITTALLTPLVGLNIILLESVFPLTLGANIGTTVTALLASLVSSSNAVQIALCHLFFNLSGILLWYPLPFMREIPLNLARKLGYYTRLYRWTCVIYILVTFMMVPALLLGVSELFVAGRAWAVLGSIIVVLLVLATARLVWWLKRQDGYSYVLTQMQERQERNQILAELPAIVKDLRAQLATLGSKSVDASQDDEQVIYHEAEE